MSDRSDKLFLGIAFIVLGIIFIIINYSDVGMGHLWPVFPLTVGIGLVLAWLKNRTNFGFLMPGTVLIVISLLFFFCAFKGWEHMSDLWPVFILAPSAGFVAMYYGGNRDKGMLVPAGILAVVGLIFIAVNFRISNFLPALMILTGIFLVLSQLVFRKQDENDFH